MSLPKTFFTLIGNKSATLDDVKVLPDKVIFHARIKKRKRNAPVVGHRRFNKKTLKKEPWELVI